jgi:hypothetical protein
LQFINKPDFSVQDGKDKKLKFSILLIISSLMCDACTAAFHAAAAVLALAFAVTCTAGAAAASLLLIVGNLAGLL